MRLGILLLTLIALAALTPRAQGEVFEVFVAEVIRKRADGTVQSFYTLQWRGEASLTVGVGEGDLEILVRVDSGTPFKPSVIEVDGSPIIPVADQGVVLVEDFARLDLERMPYRPTSITVRFGRYEPRPPAYVISGKAAGGAEKVWGYLLHVLTRKATLTYCRGVKFTVIARRETLFSTFISNLSIEELAILVTGSSPTALLDMLGSEALETSVMPLYYLEPGAPGEGYMYVNLPSTCKADLRQLKRVQGILGDVFPENPGLYEAAAISLGPACPVRLVPPEAAAVAYAVNGSLVLGPLQVGVSAEKASIVAKAYIRGLEAYSVQVYGIAPQLELPVFLSSVRVNVLDSLGRPVDNVTLVLERIDGAWRDERPVSRTLLLESVPQGQYIARVFKDGLLVGFKDVAVGSGYSEVNVYVSLVDANITIVDWLGNVIRDDRYEVVLSGGGVERRAACADGLATFRGIPAGVYTISLVDGDLRLSSTSIGIDPGRTSYMAVFNVSRLYVKVLDLLGMPVRDAQVQVKGGKELTVSTDPSGVAEVYLPAGEYEVSLKGSPTSTRVAVSGVKYVVLRKALGLDALLLAAAAVALFIAALALALRRGRGRGEIEVLELGD